MTPQLAVRWQRAHIAAKTPVTERITSLRFALAEPMQFRAGQHVDIRLTAADGYRAIRSYSIASTPDDESHVEIAVERLSDGEVSPFFHDVAREGDVIELRGPLGGHFVWTVEDGGPLLLVGGGSGVVPLLGMIRYRANIAATTPMLLLYSARTWADAAFGDELVELADRRDGFQLAMTLTREPARRAGDYARRVDGAMMREVLARLPEPPRLAFICGTNEFVNAAADGVVAAGVASSTVRTERYGG